MKIFGLSGWVAVFYMVFALPQALFYIGMTIALLAVAVKDTVRWIRRRADRYTRKQG